MIDMLKMVLIFGLLSASVATSIRNIGGRPSELLRKCEGDCDSDSDCWNNLTCWQREMGDVTPPGCNGSPYKNWDYCYEPTSIRNVGGNPSESLRKCEGDCDSDSDCSNNLKCWQREMGDVLPPGCDGSPYKNWDYCYEPTPIMKVGGNPSELLRKCEGDCDSDSDCRNNLKCWQREMGDALPLGCAGQPYKNWDYCYEPMISSIRNVGGNPSELLSKCEGDCDSDRDCWNNLKCWQREMGDALPPGCDGSPYKNWDYCY